jgi:chemotaxis protein CheZ
MARLTASRIPPDPGFDARLDGLRQAPPMSPADIERMITGVVTSLSGDTSLADLQLYRELEALSEYIHTARTEIAALRPSDINRQDLPTATDELDAVVLATADATGVILAGMEEMEKLAATLPPEQAAPIGDIVIRIYEACGFQDITGQRITKVVRTLKHIESKIEALLAVFGHDLPEPPEPEPEPVDEQAKLLNGPALPSAGGNTQADIDALLASFD